MKGMVLAVRPEMTRGISSLGLPKWISEGLRVARKQFRQPRERSR